jgi:hypothetical protein
MDLGEGLRTFNHEIHKKHEKNEEKKEQNKNEKLYRTKWSGFGYND